MPYQEDDLQRLQRYGTAQPAARPLLYRELAPGGQDIGGALTVPSVRPYRYQQAINFVMNLAAGVPQAITKDRFEVDTIVADVYSTALNSAFLGFGSQVTTTSGLEIRPGFPVSLAVENDREQWELQRVLELMAAILAETNGVAGLGPYLAPRNCFDASSYYLIATADTNVAIMLFPVSNES